MVVIVSAPYFSKPKLTISIIDFEPVSYAYNIIRCYRGGVGGSWDLVIGLIANLFVVRVKCTELGRASHRFRSPPLPDNDISVFLYIYDASLTEGLSELELRLFPFDGILFSREDFFWPSLPAGRRVGRERGSLLLLREFLASKFSFFFPGPWNHLSFY